MAKQTQLQLRVSVEWKEALRKLADEANESVTEYVFRAVKERAEGEAKRRSKVEYEAFLKIGGKEVTPGILEVGVRRKEPRKEGGDA